MGISSVNDFHVSGHIPSYVYRKLCTVPIFKCTTYVPQICGHVVHLKIGAVPSTKCTCQPTIGAS